MVDSPAILDAGPLVAFMDSSDADHNLCVNLIESMRSVMVTTWPVLTEAAYLLRTMPTVAAEMIRWVTTSNAFDIVHIPEDLGPPVAGMMERYANLELQLADASLIQLADRLNIDIVFTLDRRDFDIVRRSNNRSFLVLPER